MDHQPDVEAMTEHDVIVTYNAFPDDQIDTAINQALGGGEFVGSGYGCEGGRDSQHRFPSKAMAEWAAQKVEHLKVPLTLTVTVREVTIR